jgi:hypothetical protein
LENLGIDEKQLSVLIDWFFRKNDQNRSRVLGNNDNLTKLNNILSNPEIIKMKSGFIKLWYFIKIIILYNFIDLIAD